MAQEFVWLWTWVINPSKRLLNVPQNYKFYHRKKRPILTTKWNIHIADVLGQSCKINTVKVLNIESFTQFKYLLRIILKEEWCFFKFKSLNFENRDHGNPHRNVESSRSYLYKSGEFSLPIKRARTVQQSAVLKHDWCYINLKKLISVFGRFNYWRNCPFEIFFVWNLKDDRFSIS